MIIPNPVVKVLYHPTKDVLFVEWPEFTEEALSKAVLTLETIMNTIEKYDVKYLLTDTRKIIVGIPEQHYKELGQRFAMDLAKSSIRKFARVVTPDTPLEQTPNKAGQQGQLPIPIKSFHMVKDALDWLISKEAL